MDKQLLLLSLFLAASLAVVNDGSFATCPSGGVPAVAGSLTISAGADIALTEGQDIQCYNYTLVTPFDCAPSVAIGISPLMQA
jgi:hypothetical protein